MRNFNGRKSNNNELFSLARLKKNEALFICYGFAYRSNYVFIHRNGSNSTDMHVCRTLSFWNVLCFSSDHSGVRVLVCTGSIVYQRRLLRSIQSVLVTQIQNISVHTLSALLLRFWSHMYLRLCCLHFAYADDLLTVLLFVVFFNLQSRHGHIHNQFNHIDSIEVLKW